MIEGCADDRVAIFTKMHHATVDGVSGSNLLSHLSSLEADSEPLGLGGKGTNGRAPGDLELLGRGRAQPGDAAVLDPAADRAVDAADRRTRSTGRARVRRWPRRSPRRAPPSTAPSPATARSRWPTSSLDDIKAIKEATGSTVNDVVMAVTRRRAALLPRRPGRAAATSLLATVPVSVRSESKREQGANKVSALFAKLGTDLEDPLERLTEMTAANTHAKDHQKAISADALQDWAEFASPHTFGLAVRAYAGLRLAETHPVVHNLVVSNVPGPPVPLYFVGARIEALYPFGPVFHGAGLNITVMSNNGEMHVGVIACRESVADVDDLVRAVPGRAGRCWSRPSG